jgi:hypothetical protein
VRQRRRCLFCKRTGKEEEGGKRRTGRRGQDEDIRKNEKKQGAERGGKRYKHSLNLAWSRDLSITVFY